MIRTRWMTRLALMAVGAVVALGAIAAASAQLAGPPHLFYGADGKAGDSIGVHEADGLALIDSATVGDDGAWSIEVDASAAGDVVFSINGTPVEAAYDGGDKSPGGHTSVSLAAAMEAMMAAEADAATDDGAMEGDEDSLDGDAMDGGAMGDGTSDDGAMDDGMTDDGAMGDGMSDDGAMDDGMDDGMSDDDEGHAYPSTGSGGIASDGGVSAGLLGLLIALAAAGIAGIGLRRVRNHA